ncbi:hypothetical protein Pmani_034707 [Petrolisthes manimaculis]|uniref:C-type lectin domain-containing protein n=1 Tax=Petrolisthes manimaculis TaxID=1843537 RepID=A0AAE1NN15_9EUCA|nr:hypothetical protein Pmani_034707 [Petrolisthes manimaculis]
MQVTALLTIAALVVGVVGGPFAYDATQTNFPLPGPSTFFLSSPPPQSQVSTLDVAEPRPHASVFVPSQPQPPVPTFMVSEPQLQVSTFVPSQPQPSVPTFSVSEPQSQVPTFTVSEQRVPTFTVSRPQQQVPTFTVPEQRVPTFSVSQPQVPTFIVSEPQFQESTFVPSQPQPQVTMFVSSRPQPPAPVFSIPEPQPQVPILVTAQTQPQAPTFVPSQPQPQVSTFVPPRQSRVPTFISSQTQARAPTLVSPSQEFSLVTPEPAVTSLPPPTQFPVIVTAESPSVPMPVVTPGVQVQRFCDPVSRPLVDDALGEQVFHFSWCHDGGREYNWQGAANYCRSLGRGFQSVSLETSEKDSYMAALLRTHNVGHIWTSGSRTGSLWSWNNGVSTSHRNWSHTGRFGIRQPDNAEGNEVCLGLLNNFYGDGVKWHDIACHHTKRIVCQARRSFLESVNVSPTPFPYRRN